MESYYKKLLLHLRANISHKYALPVSMVLLLLSWAFSSLYYKGLYPGNNLSWIGWALALVTFFYAFLPSGVSFKKLFKEIKREDVFIAVFIVVIYFASHLWNFSSAPWNQNGLFDDAAWDIYFAKNQVFSGVPFQPAFFDSVGLISREVVFHYYISVFFKVFGYNLLVFNFSLLILGFVTVFFTTFLIHRIFKDVKVTLLSAMVINFFPLHYMHIFMGHRYAIAAPLMVVSLYFLYTSFAKKSFLRAAASALFAALCWGSSIMGKQFILGLVLSAASFVVFTKSGQRSKENISTALVWGLGFIVSSALLLAYIAFNRNDYFLREQGLLQEFFDLYKGGGLGALKPFFDQLAELFFAKHSFRRQFLPDFYIVPLSYYLFLVPGLLIAAAKKRFEIVFLSFIPILGAIVSGPYDFRVLLAVPVWVVAMAYTLNYLFKLPPNRPGRILLVALGIAGLLLGLIPSISYLWNVSKSPNYLYLLPHKDVAVSRLVQDIVVGGASLSGGVHGLGDVAGSSFPTGEMKPDEFSRRRPTVASYDTLVCPYSSYAIMHLYLQDFDDKRILSFCNQGIQLLKKEEEILANNIAAVTNYKPNTNDLKLIWEVSDKTGRIINLFKKYEKYGSEETIYGSSDGLAFSLYILTIKAKNIKSFQRDVFTLASGQGQ